MVKPVPEGHTTVTPHLAMDDCTAAIEFYEKAFNAERIAVVAGAPGTVVHAEIRIGNAIVWLADAVPDHAKTATMLGGSPVSLHLYLEDVDAVWKQAIDAGAKIKMPLENMFWGDRYGMIEDPFGMTWELAQHIEDVRPEDMPARAAEAMKP